MGVVPVEFHTWYVAFVSNLASIVHICCRVYSVLGASAESFVDVFCSGAGRAERRCALR